MGAPMLAALLRSGFDARGYDTRPDDEFGTLANAVSNDPIVFADGLTTAITVVRDIAQTEDVLFGRGDLVGKATDLQTLIISSTLSPRYLADLRERVPTEIEMIDAPMSGAAIAAEEQRLSFMLGGNTEALDRLQPVFETMGKHFHRMGNFGAGMQAKVLNNLLAASHTAMTRLVLSWADEAGLDEAKLLQLIDTSSGQNWLASGFDTIEFARDGYAADNSIGILKKDVESALDSAPSTADTRLLELLQEMIGVLQPRQK